MSRKKKMWPKLGCFQKTPQSRPVGRVILSGQAHYTKATFGTDECQAEHVALVQAWHGRGCEPLKRPRLPGELQGPKTVAQLSDAYLEHLRDTGAYQRNGRPTSQLGKIEVALRELKAVIGKVPVEAFQKVQLVRFRDSLQSSGRLQISTVNVKVRLVRQMLRWAEERGFYPERCLSSVLTLKPLKAPQKTRRKPVAEETIKAILPHLPRPVAAMVEVQWLTGMRPGEVCAMRWTDIDCSQDPWVYRVATAKTDHLGHETVYYLNRRCQELLQQFRGPGRKTVFNPRDAVVECHGTSRPVGNGTVGTRYKRLSYGQCIRRACERAGVEKFTPHAIRHAVLTAVANDPARGPAAAQMLANHKTMRSTMVYLHPDRRLAIEAARHRSL